jgi:D-tyrosyl-tRNA(Tyr) deacylase
MRILLQRVSAASVAVDGAVIGKIKHGLVALVGIGHNDSTGVVERLASKAVELRIFEDDAGKMNRSLREMCGAPNSGSGMLIVSQFTLYADVRKGRRPSFTDAATPEHARSLVDHFADAVRELKVPVAMGQFGAHMVVSLDNDGPVTIWIDSDDLARD